MAPLTEALRRLADGHDLGHDLARDAVSEIMGGEAPDAAIAAFLAGLRVKGESVDDLSGAVAAVRSRMTVLEPGGPSRPTLDTCGTGGDGACSVNISTATAIVVAACGVPVAKHGNRSASGNSGSAEVLAELGVDIEAEPDVLRRCLAELGLTFLFAPKFHPAMRFAAPVRRVLPFRTLFNLVGPLANPALPAYQLIGVPVQGHAVLIAETVARLGVRRAAVVTGADGLDEVSLDGPTRVLWVESGTVRLEMWPREEFDLPVVRSADLRVSGPSESAARIRGLLAAEPGPARDTVLANASAALLVADRVVNLRDGVALAARAIDGGNAARLLGRWAGMTRGEG